MSAAPVVHVPFHGEQLEAVRMGERVLVPLRRMCEGLDVGVAGQLKKLRGKPWAVVEMISMTGPDGKTYRTACLELDAVPMWLAGLDAERVKPDLRDKLVLYQREAAQAVRDHFFGPRALAPAPAAPPAPALPPLRRPRALPVPISPTVRKLETVDRVLDEVETDLGVYLRLRSAGDRHAFYEAIQGGLQWCGVALVSLYYAREEPRVAPRLAAACERQTRLAQTFDGSPRRRGTPAAPPVHH